MEANTEGRARALKRMKRVCRGSDDSTIMQWQQDRVKNIKSPEASRIRVDGADVSTQELRSVDTQVSTMPVKKTPGTASASPLHSCPKPRKKHVKTRLPDGRKLSSPVETRKHINDMKLLSTSLTALVEYQYDNPQRASPSEVQSIVEASDEDRRSWAQSDTQKYEANSQRRKCRLPKWPVSTVLGEETKPSDGDWQVDFAAKSFVNALQPVTSSETGPSSEVAASRSESTLEECSNESSLFIQALRVMETDRRASVTTLMNDSNNSVTSMTRTNLCSLNYKTDASMDSSSTLGHQTSLGLGSNGPPARAQLKLRGGMIMDTKHPLDYDQSKSKKVIEAYKTASQILENEVGWSSTTYVTPYGNPQENYVTPYGDPQEKYVTPYANQQETYITPYGPPEASLDSSAKYNEVRRSCSLNSPPITLEVATPKANTKERYSTDKASTEHISSSGSQNHDIDHAEVDRLLLLAGGGSLTNDEDTDDEVEFLASFPKAEKDSDVQAIFIRIYDIMAGRGQKGEHCPRTKKVVIVSQS